MKKIISCLLVSLLTILFIPSVYASNNVVIESVTLKEKSEDLIELSKPTIEGMNINFNLSFLNIGDKAKYEVIISNNSNKDYYIDNQTKFNKSNYITYTYEFTEKVDKIEKNSKLKMYITIEYTTPVPPEKLVNGMYTEDNAMSMDLSDVIITNPSTYGNIIALLLIFTILILITIIKISKKKKIGINLLLIGILLIPITTYALERITIKAQTKITIEEQRNMIEARYSNNSGSRDFWQYGEYIRTISFKTAIEEPASYEYVFDVSEAKNNSIIAYLVKNTEDSTKYDLYIMCNGFIYANPDSSSVFSMFHNLKKINNIEYYKTNYATNMAGMFSVTQSLEELDLSNFDTSKVTNMSNMFQQRWGSGGSSLLKKLDLSNFDTSNVIDMNRMFMDNTQLEELDLSSFDTTKVENMEYMFYECMKLKRLDLSNFNTSNVTNIYAMFCEDYELEYLDVSSFNTSKVTNMAVMFGACRKLESIDVSGFDTSNVTSMSAMFSNCNKLESIDLSNFDTSKVTNMRGMFRYCTTLTSLDLSSFNTTNVKNMEDMFYESSNLENIFVSNNWNVDNVTSSSNMFKNCTKLPNFSSAYTNKERANTSPTGYLTLKS